MTESSEYKIDHHIVGRIVTTLYCVADMLLAPLDHPAHLTDNQKQALTSPPGLALSRERLAINLRLAARAIEKQMPDDAPDTSGPYALRSEHPPPFE
jgi:hypothetical protein